MTGLRVLGPLTGLGWGAGAQGGLAAAPRSRWFAVFGTKQTAIITVQIYFVAVGAMLCFGDYYTATTIVLLALHDPAL